MASTNHTQTLELCQWVGTDPVLMADFNDDNAKIDTAVAALQSAMPRMVCGSYTGNGSYGSAHPRTLHFAFQPRLLLIQSEDHARLGPSGDAEFVNGWLMAIRGVTTAYTGSYNDNASVSFQWDGNDVSWYTTSAAPGAQCNASGRKYYYFAIG